MTIETAMLQRRSERPNQATTIDSMMRANPRQHRLQRRIVMQPVPRLLVRGPERIADPLVGNGREFLDTDHRQRDPHVLLGRSRGALLHFGGPCRPGAAPAGGRCAACGPGG